MRNTPDRFGENIAMEPVDGAQRRSRGKGLRECLLLGLVLSSLAPRHASAGDQPQNRNAHSDAGLRIGARVQLAAPPFPAPFAFSAPPAMPAFSPSEFRPRKPGLLDNTAALSETFVIDAPMLGDTSLARELREARSQDRVRLLTLWQTRASSLSLQAGRRGAPSLQWTTPLMHRDAALPGLFDRLLAVSPRGFGGSFRGGTLRTAGPIAPGKSLDLGAPINTK
jgi:hypothetical protein